MLLPRHGLSGTAGARVVTSLAQSMILSVLLTVLPIITLIEDSISCVTYLFNKANRTLCIDLEGFIEILDCSKPSYLLLLIHSIIRNTHRMSDALSICYSHDIKVRD